MNLFVNINGHLCYAKSDKISKMQLYNSNPQIHYQDRYNEHQCVKIIEFNFNSRVFLVMYQEIIFVNQDACSLNQENRRQFFIISVSER